jgi:hypothetical protein
VPLRWYRFGSAASVAPKRRCHSLANANIFL